MTYLGLYLTQSFDQFSYKKVRKSKRELTVYVDDAF